MQILQGHEGIVLALLFAPDGDTLVSAGKDGSVRCWNGWGEGFEYVRFSAPAHSLAISSDNRYLALGGKDGALGLWDIRANTRVEHIKNEGPVTGLAFMPNDSSIAFSLGTLAIDNTPSPSGGSVRFWNWKENRLLSPSVDVAPSQAVRVMAAHNAHRLLSWVTQNHGLTVWPITGLTTTRFSLKSACRSLAFSPDAKLLAAAVDWKAQIFDIERKQEKFTLSGHKGVVSSSAFSPDGRHILTGSWDKTVKIWDSSGGRELQSFEWPIGRVGAVAYAPDGLRAAAAGDEGAIVVWDVDE